MTRPVVNKLPKKKMKFMDRKLTKGLGEAVARRTILRTDEKDKLEVWADVAKRVATGNTSLIKGKKHREAEYELMRKHIANASLF